MIYLDWNATAPLSPAARAAWLTAQEISWANPASIHALGQQARHATDQAKTQCAKVLGCAVHELVVTSGGTEANALAIHGVLAKGGEVLASAVEHSSVLRNAERYPCDVVPVDGEARVDPAAVVARLKPATRLVAIQFANNETGTVQDVAAIVRAVKSLRPDVLILADCCQGVGKVAVDVRALGVDLASVAGHKCGAPKGVGLLYVRNGVTLSPQILGGRQQQDRRSGTEDAATLVALAAALQDATRHVAQETVHQRELIERCFAQISEALPKVRWLGQAAARLPNTLALVHPGVTNHELVLRLDLAGFAVSTGSACMAARGEPSHVVAAMGLEPALARSAIRVSIGPTTTAEELATFAKAYVQEVSAMVAAG